MADEKKKEGPEWHKPVILVAVLLVRAFAIMLALGALHHDWTTQVPTLGFWASLAVAAAITGIKKS